MALAALLRRREELTQALSDNPYDCILYLRRAVVYASLGYPDLAAGDAYRALLLTDEASDESFEYYEQAVEALQGYGDPKGANNPLGDVGEASDPDGQDTQDDGPSPAVRRLAYRASIRAYQILARSLTLCGSLRSAYDFCERGLAAAPQNKELLRARDGIKRAAAKRGYAEDDSYYSFPGDLPDRGLVRREVYPWNDHEPDRCSPEALAFLNGLLAKVAPKCEVRATELPVLGDTSGEKTSDSEKTSDNEEKTSDSEEKKTCIQLGIFAKEYIAPGEPVLKEYSLLTANNRHKESTCDACGREVRWAGEDEDGDGDGDDGDNDAAAGSGAHPFFGDGRDKSSPVGCPDCDDTVFCDEFCRDQALAAYHPAVCDREGVDAIAKDVEDAREADDALYVLLLARVLAMAAHQEVHPLEVDQVKYIWGDFVVAVDHGDEAEEGGVENNDSGSLGGTLPFSFSSNISTPLHILEQMDIDIFTTPAYDTWVLNTLYAKFRGTASARKSRRDGRPDVAAVHPLWCLANHDCNPNVTWSWGGRMVLWAREERVWAEEEEGSSPLKGGLQPGDEVLNHYCDVTLPVQQRREWASGSLGGHCMCLRCRTEAAAEEKKVGETAAALGETKLA